MKHLKIFIFVLLGTGLGLERCTSIPQYSGLMNQTQMVDLTARELRLRLNDLALTYSNRIAQVADQMILSSDSAEIRKNALLWKISAIPVAQQAFFISDPLAALADSWAFNMQLQYYFASEKGERDFGSLRDLGLNMTQDLESEFKLLAQMVTSEGDSVVPPKVVYDLAKEFPIESPLCYRRTTMAFLADLHGNKKRDLVNSVGEMVDGVYDLREHLDFYMAHLPTQARWQGEWLIDGTFERPEIRDALGNLTSMSGGINRAVPVIEGLPQLADSLMKLGFDQVDRQRILILYAIAQERAQILEALAEERGLILADIDRQRNETLHEVEYLRKGITTDVAEISRDLVDHVFLRLAQVLGGAVFLIFLGIFLLRLTRKK